MVLRRDPRACRGHGGVSFLNRTRAVGRMGFAPEIPCDCDFRNPRLGSLTPSRPDDSATSAVGLPMVLGGRIRPTQGIWLTWAPPAGFRWTLAGTDQLHHHGASLRPACTEYP
jgi:hypothetical protein